MSDTNNNRLGSTYQWPCSPYEYLLHFEALVCCLVPLLQLGSAGTDPLPEVKKTGQAYHLAEDVPVSSSERLKCTLIEGPGSLF
jgi:hypothetical protein